MIWPPANVPGSNNSRSGSEPGPPPAVTDEPSDRRNERSFVVARSVLVLERVASFGAGRPGRFRRPASTGWLGAARSILQALGLARDAAGAAGRDNDSRCWGWPCRRRMLPDGG